VSADSGRSFDHNGTAAVDWLPSIAWPADSRAAGSGRFATKFLHTPTASSHQLVKKRLRLPQIDGAKPLGEPGARDRELRRFCLGLANSGAWSPGGAE